MSGSQHPSPTYSNLPKAAPHNRGKTDDGDPHRPSTPEGISREHTMWDTPIRAGRSIHSAEYASGSLEARRSLVRQDVGNVPVVSVHYFLECTAPNYSREQAEELKGKLIRAGAINSDNSWRGFKIEPKDSPHNEGKTFRHLLSIFNDIIESSQNATLQPIYNGAITPWSQRKNNSKPDGFLELRQRSSILDHNHHAWEDIVQAWEFKKQNQEGDRLDNFSKILWSGHHILRNDPRRQWTTGLTIENISARLWYFDRSRVMVTQPFNFREDHITLIRFWRGIAFEQPEKLGYDDTITLVREGNSLQYEIRLKDETFRTVKLLSGFRADAIVGRATRVWLAYSKDSPTKRRIIKDIWMRESAKSETEIRNYLTSCIRANPDEKERMADLALYRRYFLTHDSYLSGPVVADGLNPATTLQFVAGRILGDDDIEGALDFLATSSLKPEKFMHSGSQLEVYPSSMSEASVSSSSQLPKLTASQYRPRIHYREVFEEECEPFESLRSVPEMCQTLYDCTIALQLLWKYGFVHRDVSTGNVLWDSVLQRGCLSDLEFVKNIRDEGSDDVKTGTPHFMAVEICLRLPLNAFAHSVTDLILTEEAIESDANADLMAPRTQGIRFHALHDIESIWWIAVWTLVKRIPESDYPTKTDEELSHQERLAHAVFPPSEPGNSRHRMFILENEFLAATKNLNEMTVAFAPYVSALRKYLVKQYAVKPPNDIGYDQFRDVYAPALQILGFLCGKAKRNPISVIPLVNVIERRRQQKDREGRRERGVIDEEADLEFRVLG